MGVGEGTGGIIFICQRSSAPTIDEKIISCAIPLDTHSHWHYSTKTWLRPKGWRRTSKGIDGPLLHLRALYVLLSSQRSAGVYSGLDSEYESRFPMTHPPNGWWVFIFSVHNFAKNRTRLTNICDSCTGGEAANAQVCKTCIRGFDSRPVLQNLFEQSV